MLAAGGNRMVRLVRFTRHYALGLVGGIGFGLFLALSVLEGLAADGFPRKLVGVAGLLTAMATQFLYVGEMKRLHRAGGDRPDQALQPPTGADRG